MHPYLEPLKKATGRFFAQGHLPAALKSIPQTIKQIHLGERPPDIISEGDLPQSRQYTEGSPGDGLSLQIPPPQSSWLHGNGGAS